MGSATLALSVVTPHALVAELDVASLRFPTETGQVGLRPRAEPAVFALEPGLVLARTPAGLRYVATAGGLLRSDGARALLLTPLAVTGEDAADVRRRIDAALAAPDPGRELRRTIGGLEAGILRELRADRAERSAWRAP
jgi:F0F1-type ATP synthase epsilon subunit